MEASGVVGNENQIVFRALTRLRVVKVQMLWFCYVSFGGLLCASVLFQQTLALQVNVTETDNQLELFGRTKITQDSIYL